MAKIIDRKLLNPLRPVLWLQQTIEDPICEFNL